MDDVRTVGPFTEEDLLAEAVRDTGVQVLPPVFITVADYMEETGCSYMIAMRSLKALVEEDPRWHQALANVAGRSRWIFWKE